MRLCIRSMSRTWQITFFFFNDTATTEIYTLSLHDALPIFVPELGEGLDLLVGDGHEAVVEEADVARVREAALDALDLLRSEEHTSELQSRQYLVSRLLLEKQNQTRL